MSIMDNLDLVDEASKSSEYTQKIPDSQNLSSMALSGKLRGAL